MRNTKRLAALAMLLAAVVVAVSQGRPHDPGPRGGAAGAGGYYPSLNTDEQAEFNAGIDEFTQDEGVAREKGDGGLGPGFNGTSCSSCHSQPAVLGSSPAMNPQIAAAAEMGATNVIPSFISPTGPAREARFLRFSDGSTDGGVHNLFTITGRTDAPGCNLQQPNFAAELAAHNVIFRIPTPTFGLGLVENTSDAMLVSNLRTQRERKHDLGIAGRFNRSGNDGTITKFGWKAQNKSLMMFAGEAYNVEMGVSNDVMSNERNAVRGCVFNSTPEDTHPDSDVEAFVDAMRFSAAPTPATPNSDTRRGQQLFEDIGCNLCHSESLTTASAPYTGMSKVAYHPFSDFALHHMGSNLADGVSQGMAGSDEFRSAPLWGVGQRLFFLHDGRTSDLLDAIQEHASRGSEANGVIRRFNNLSPSQQQSLLDFLRSL